MTFGAAVRSCLGKYATFSGRSPRSEFWKFVLFNLLGLIALVVVNSVIFGPELQGTIKVSVDAAGKVTQTVSQKQVYSDGRLGDIFGIAMLLPMLAVTWRRLHDTGRPGWKLLITFPLAILTIYAVLIFGPSVTIPINTSTFGAGYTGPTEISVPNIPAWLFFALWAWGVGSMILSIIWLARKSQHGPNHYGPNPLEVTP